MHGKDVFIGMYITLSEIFVVSILLLALFLVLFVMYKKLEHKSSLGNGVYDKNINYLLSRYNSFKEIADEDRYVFYQLILDYIYRDRNISLEDYLDVVKDRVQLEEYFYDVINDYYKQIYIVEDEDDVYYYAKSSVNDLYENYKVVKMNNYQMELLFRRYKRFNVIDFAVFVTEEYKSQYYNLKESELQLEDIH